MIHGWRAIYLREMLILRRRLSRLVASWAVSPLLYLIAFGLALGKEVRIEGHPYIEFLIPGLAAMASMTHAFSIGSEINISRFYWHIFEEFQSSPISDTAYVLGEVLAGMTRALLAGLVILALSACFGVFLRYTLSFWVAFLLNSFVFSALAVGLAMLVESHADQAMMNSFIITPMAFLGGTFFPLANLPTWAQLILTMLPLSHAANAMRAAAFGAEPDMSAYGVLLAFGAAAFVFASFSVSRAKD